VLVRDRTRPLAGLDVTERAYPALALGDRLVSDDEDVTAVQIRRRRLAEQPCEIVSRLQLREAGEGV